MRVLGIFIDENDIIRTAEYVRCATGTFTSSPYVLGVLLLFVMHLWCMSCYSHGYVEPPSRAYYTVLRLAVTRIDIEYRLPLQVPS
jgi:hypothetical protein